MVASAERCAGASMIDMSPWPPRHDEEIRWLEPITTEFRVPGIVDCAVAFKGFWLRCSTKLPLAFPIRRFGIFWRELRLPPISLPPDQLVNESWGGVEPGPPLVHKQCWNTLALADCTGTLSDWAKAFAENSHRIRRAQYWTDPGVVSFDASIIVIDDNNEDGYISIRMPTSDTARMRAAVATLRDRRGDIQSPLTIDGTQSAASASSPLRPLLGIRSWRVGKNIVVDESVSGDLRMRRWYDAIGRHDPNTIEPFFTVRTSLPSSALADAVDVAMNAIDMVRDEIAKIAPSALSGLKS